MYVNILTRNRFLKTQSNNMSSRRNYMLEHVRWWKVVCHENIQKKSVEAVYWTDKDCFRTFSYRQDNNTKHLCTN